MGTELSKLTRRQLIARVEELRHENTVIWERLKKANLDLNVARVRIGDFTAAIREKNRKIRSLSGTVVRRRKQRKEGHG